MATKERSSIDCRLMEIVMEEMAKATNRMDSMLAASEQHRRPGLARFWDKDGS